MRFVLLNARRTSNKTAELEEIPFGYDLHITTVTETWVRDALEDNEVIPAAHNTFRQGRGSRCNGFALTIKKKVSCIVLNNIPDHESLRCQNKYRGRSTVDIGVYHPPGSPESFLLKFPTIFKGFTSLVRELY